MKYATDKHIPFVVLAGEDEIQQEKFMVKDMDAHEQKLMTLEEMKILIENK